jgi:hypothetical protein
VLGGIGFRHQDLDVAPDELGGDIAKEPFGRVVDRADSAISVDDDNSIDRCGDDRAIKGVAETPVLALQTRRCRTQVPDP